MRAYTPMNYNVVALIRQDPTYKKMTYDDMVGRIINHEMHIEEVKDRIGDQRGMNESQLKFFDGI
jgi:hypothetical protein